MYLNRIFHSEIDECASNPCVNGSCEDQLDGYVCTCDVGFTDPECATEVDDCNSNPCVNGDCNNLVGAWSCTCDAGFSGLTCDAQPSDTGKNWFSF